MKTISILLILVGIGGIGMGLMMVGDIGVGAILAGLTGLLSGVGFWLAQRSIVGHLRAGQGDEGL